jgi:hypothetical protein
MKCFVYKINKRFVLFKVPQILSYYAGTEDPIEHLENF